MTYFLQVHSWLLLTFVYAFYLQFSNFDKSNDQEVWMSVCQSKFNNCTQIITNTNTEAIKENPDILTDCFDFFQKCTQTELDESTFFNNWKVIVKVLSMAAGELGYDDLAFEDNPFLLLTFTFFTILVLFVIMNLMTSIAVNDIHEIRNESRDDTWFKLMLSLMWYDDVLPKCLRRKPKDCTDVISFNLNETVSLDPRTWFKVFTMMPNSVLAKSKSNAHQALSNDNFSLIHNMDKFEDIVIIFGTKKNFREHVLTKGTAYTRPVSYWNTEFAIVDYKNGYDHRRKMYRAQKFIVTGSAKLEIKFREYQGGQDKGEFVAFDRETDKKLEDAQIIQFIGPQSEQAKAVMVKTYKRN